MVADPHPFHVDLDSDPEFLNICGSGSMAGFFGFFYMIHVNMELFLFFNCGSGCSDSKNDVDSDPQPWTGHNELFFNLSLIA